MRELLDVALPAEPDEPTEANTDDVLHTPCPCCGAIMRIIEVFEASSQSRHRANSIIVRIDTS
jgi:hypothetical protein